MKNLIQCTQSSEANEAIDREVISQLNSAFPSSGATLVGKWQERGFETLPGYTSLKLRVVLALPESVMTASAAG
jgi:hypothetical protein